MIVNRRTYTIKNRRWKEAVALVKEMIEISPPPHAWRMYGPSLTGRFGTLVMEFEYESVEECQASWKEFTATPEITPLVEKWSDIKLPGGTSELWSLIE